MNESNRASTAIDIAISQSRRTICHAHRRKRQQPVTRHSSVGNARRYASLNARPPGRTELVFRVDDKIKHLRNTDAAWHIQAGTCWRNVANSAIEHGASLVEDNTARLQSSLTSICSVVGHGQALWKSSLAYWARDCSVAHSARKVVKNALTI